MLTLFKIDSKSGYVTWEKYQFSPYDTHEILHEKYPELQPGEIGQKAVGSRHLPYRSFYFPTVEINSCSVQITGNLSQKYISLICLSRQYESQSGWNKFIDEQLLTWIKQAKEWLLSELGQPHRIVERDLFDETQRFKPSELTWFNSWEYSFEWGKASFSYDSLQIAGAIFIIYDYNYQIKSWAELLLHCDYIEAEAQKYQLVNRANISAIRELLQLIRQDFDYKIVRPIATVDSLLFHPKALSKDGNFVVVTADVRYPNKLYHVNRTDMVGAIRTSDKVILLKSLKKFFEDI